MGFDLIDVGEVSEKGDNGWLARDHSLVSG